jgi:hypothetical protein
MRKEAERKERRGKTIRWTAYIVAAVVLVGGLVTIGIVTTHHSSATTASTDVATATLGGPQGPEGIPAETGTPLAGLSLTAAGQTIDGVQCGAEQLVYHIHAHLTVYANGAMRPVPGGIGQVGPQASGSGNSAFYGAQVCYYTLHTHAADGVIHVEAPTETTYTLGQFFALWGQTLSSSQVGPAKGTVTAYLNGKPYTGDPTSIPLTAHADIQLDVGTVVAPKKVDWSVSQL